MCAVERLPFGATEREDFDAK